MTGAATRILVPIKVRALVIDDRVLKSARPVVEQESGRTLPGDGRWSPAAPDYRPALNSLSAPGPAPFLGAAPVDDEPMLTPAASLPDAADRGVYVHWVLPPALRRSWVPGQVELPPLPDRWLVVRFARPVGEAGEATVDAWFLDASQILEPGDDSGASLIVPTADGRGREVRHVGRAVPLDAFSPTTLTGGRRTRLTATGNHHTGSVSFTGSIAENRNILSWHDADPPPGHVLSYQVTGWYGDPADEPTRAIPTMVPEEEGWDWTKFSAEAGWHLEGGLPGELGDARVVFHGMVAHVNHADLDGYRGPLLGYPGAPSAHGGRRDARRPLRIGVGHTAADALVALASEDRSTSGEGAALWKALEAVVHDQASTLRDGWNQAPREQRVHAGWFDGHDGGRVWAIAGAERNPVTMRPGTGLAVSDGGGSGEAGSSTGSPDGGGLEDDAAQSAATPEPTPEQAQALRALNAAQAAADRAARALAGAQAELHTRWWQLCRQFRLDDWDVEAQESACREMVTRVERLRAELAPLTADAEQRRKALAVSLEGTGLELHVDPAPRFWSPADPVVLVGNYGKQDAHVFPNPLPCRTAAGVATSAAIEGKVSHAVSAAPWTADLGALLSVRFPADASLLRAVVDEAAVAEAALAHLARATRRDFLDEADWERWCDGLDAAVHPRDGDAPPASRLTVRDAAGAPVDPIAVLRPWREQPWSPLFLEWEVEWRPTPAPEESFDGAWRLGGTDYHPLDNEPPAEQGLRLRGRSLLAPVGGAETARPLDDLRGLLAGTGTGAIHPEVHAHLSRFLPVWDRRLEELQEGGLLGQALTGLHEALLRRDTTLPRVNPDARLPWHLDPDGELSDARIAPLLTAPEGGTRAPRLAPPTEERSRSFGLTRGGALHIRHLWLVDDFGQTCDLLHGSRAGRSSGQTLNPRVCWGRRGAHLALPPRVLQPTRLIFESVRDDDGPIAGWVFYNQLDGALAICDKEGGLLGEVLHLENAKGEDEVRWEGLTEATSGSGGIEEILDEGLRAFTRTLVGRDGPRRLGALLDTIDAALVHVRPAEDVRDRPWAGRPLALVRARVGFEVAGDAWADPASPTPPADSGSAALTGLRLPVRLGCADDSGDGLVGTFLTATGEEDGFGKMVPAPWLGEGAPDDAPGQEAAGETLRAGFGTPRAVTLLMDPRGSVQATSGLLPARAIRLEPGDYQDALERMETTFRVGPVLLPAGEPRLPVPAGPGGHWWFRAGDDDERPVDAFDRSMPFEGARVIAMEGRLTLRRDPETDE